MIFLNLAFFVFGVYLFYYCGIYCLALMFIRSLLLEIDLVKFICIVMKLNSNIRYYINNNTDEIHEPYFFVDAIVDTFYHFVRLVHYLFTVTVLFLKGSNSFIQYFWLIFLIQEFNKSWCKIRANFDNLKKFRYIRKNLDVLFPRSVYLGNNETCSICIDELIIARKLKSCGHAFHLKCIFNLIKFNKNAKCPVCRRELDNLNNYILNNDAN
jgi:hypothetical protein